MEKHINHKRLDGSTSRSLIVRLQDNEVPAWHELVELYSPLICYWCQRMGLPAQDCNDVAQDVFRSVVSSIETFRKSRPSDTFRGWLRTVTKNKVRDHFRQRDDDMQPIGGSEALIRMAQTPADDDILMHDEEELQQEHALFLRGIKLIRKDFTDRTWQAFWQVTVEGKTAAEAAEALNMKSGSVRVAKSRVLKRLRQQLGEML